MADAALLEIQKRDDWEDTLEAIASELGMVATLVDRSGRILLHKGTYPEICMRVRAKEETLTFVCGQTSQALMKQAERSRRPIVDLCQIGLAKMVVPLFQGECFLGAVTACARALADEEPDLFLIAQELDVKEEEAEELLRDVPQLEEWKIEEVANRWAVALKRLMSGAGG